MGKVPHKWQNGAFSPRLVVGSGMRALEPAHMWGEVHNRLQTGAVTMARTQAVTETHGPPNLSFLAPVTASLRPTTHSLSTCQVATESSPPLTLCSMPPSTHLNPFSQTSSFTRTFPVLPPTLPTRCTVQVPPETRRPPVLWLGQSTCHPGLDNAPGWLRDQLSSSSSPGRPRRAPQSNAIA